MSENVRSQGSRMTEDEIALSFGKGERLLRMLVMTLTAFIAFVAMPSDLFLLSKRQAFFSDHEQLPQIWWDGAASFEAKVLLMWVDLVCLRTWLCVLFISGFAIHEYRSPQFSGPSFRFYLLVYWSVVLILLCCIAQILQIYMPLLRARETHLLLSEVS